jgi:Mrp family chromosome partitioning ATPase/capsular polysaccharide biosynthesis protein
MAGPRGHGRILMNETTDATAIFAPLWRRKWLILAVAIVVGAASYFYYKGQRATFGANTQLYLGVSNEELAPGERANAKPGVTISDQSAVINTIVVEKVRQQLRAEGEAESLKGAKIRAKAPEKGSEFITISTEAHTPRFAALLANLTAKTYIKREEANHRRSVEKAIGLARGQLRRLEATSVARVTPGSAAAKGKTPGSSSPNPSSVLQETNLSTKINQLESSIGLASAQQLKPALPQTTEQLAPKPRKDAIFGFVLGLVLAAIAAYVLGRFDRRLRSLAGIEEAFKAQILTALPKVARPITNRAGTPTPSRQLLEPLRRLHTALQLGDRLEHQPHSGGRVILFISADAGDGKSTLVADLALVQRDAGQRVAVVEANFRRPVQTRLLGLDGKRGLADVLAGTVSVEDAVQRVTPPHPVGVPDASESAVGVVTAVESRAGSLFLLAGDRSVPNPPALLAHESFPGLLSSLAADFDSVLIDAPSPLEFSDVMPLLSVVERIVIVARVGHTREIAAQRLVHMLANVSSSPVLGVVANNVARKDSERYGFSASDGRVWPGKLIGR